MKRQIIRIDENKCTGCGLCVSSCAEGAIQIVDGKARLVSERWCDGLGACLGHCPEGAITIEERAAEPYDERQVLERLIAGGPQVIAAHLHHLLEHGQAAYYQQAIAALRERGIAVPAEQAPAHGHGGCPGARMIDRRHQEKKVHDVPANKAAQPATSALRQWPVQLRLLRPDATFFDQADLLVATDCVPFAMPDFHRALLDGKVVIVFCPKLDRDVEEYVAKLATIFRIHRIRSITIARMEVPCCGGVGRVVAAAQAAAGTTIPVNEVVITLEGALHARTV